MQAPEAQQLPGLDEDEAVVARCWHRHRSERAKVECERLQARPRCVQCGTLVRGWNVGAAYRTGAVTCADCHYADFG